MIELVKAGTSDALVINGISKRSFDRRFSTSLISNRKQMGLPYNFSTAPRSTAILWVCLSSFRKKASSVRSLHK